MSDYWRSYHLIPCVKKTCEVNKFERKSTFHVRRFLSLAHTNWKLTIAGGKWWLSHCTGKNGPGG